MWRLDVFLLRRMRLKVRMMRRSTHGNGPRAFSKFADSKIARTEILFRRWQRDHIGRKILTGLQAEPSGGGQDEPADHGRAAPAAGRSPKLRLACDQSNSAATEVTRPGCRISGHPRKGDHEEAGCTACWAHA